MANKSTTSLSDLMVIRDILMGEIIEQYNDRFEKLEAELQAQLESLNEKEAALDERINALDALLAEKSEDISSTFQSKLDDNREALGAMLLNIGQQLKEG